MHCVAGTPGAEYHPLLELPADTVHVVKGESRQDYSGFSGRIVDEDGVSLAGALRPAASRMSTSSGSRPTTAYGRRRWTPPRPASRSLCSPT